MSKENEKLVRNAKKRFEAIRDEQAKMREVGDRCNRNVAGEMWEPNDVASRENDNRPMITINKLEAPVNLVANKNAMERSRIKVAPFEDSDKDTARVINGLIRHIQYSEKSNADIAYAKAFSDTSTRGYGYFRVNTDYCNDKSFDQEIYIEEVKDPHSIYLDPGGEIAFVTEWVPKDDFEEKYPDANPVSWDEVDTNDVFFREDEICVAEYWKKEYTPTKIYKIKLSPDPFSVGGQPRPQLDELLQPEQIPQDEILVVTEEELKDFANYEVLVERKTKIPKVMQYIIAGDQVLEENEWTGKYIPIVGVYGKYFKIDGDVFYKSVIYDAIEPNHMYNYYRSQEAEMLMLQPKTPWIGAEGQFDGHEDAWDNAHIDRVGHLEYNLVTVNGQIAPPPQRPQAPQVQAGFVQSVHQSSDEIKATTGIYDASLGAGGNEKSGKAILARQQQGDIGTYHLTLSFNEAMRRTGLILVDLIPHIYDSARTIRILGEDMTEEVISINQAAVGKDGKEYLYDLTTGTYDVKIETGPGLNTRRMDAAENLVSLVQAIPEVGQTIPDLIVKNLDVEYSDEIALRLKAGMDPRLFARMKEIEAEEKGGTSPEQQQIMALNQKLQQAMSQIQQAAQMMQGMQQENKQLKGQMQQKAMQDAQLKAQTDIQTTMIKTRGSIEEEKIKAAAQNNLLRNGRQAPQR